MTLPKLHLRLFTKGENQAEKILENSCKFAEGKYQDSLLAQKYYETIKSYKEKGYAIKITEKKVFEHNNITNCILHHGLIYCTMDSYISINHFAYGKHQISLLCKVSKPFSTTTVRNLERKLTNYSLLAQRYSKTKNSYMERRYAIKTRENKVFE